MGLRPCLLLQGGLAGLIPEGLCQQQQGACVQARGHQGSQVGLLKDFDGGLCPLHIVLTQDAAQQRGKWNVCGTEQSMSFAYGSNWTLHSRGDVTIGWSRTAWIVPSWPTYDMHCSMLIEPQGGLSKLGHCCTHSELCRWQSTRQLDHCKP